MSPLTIILGTAVLYIVVKGRYPFYASLVTSSGRNTDTTPATRTPTPAASGMTVQNGYG